MEKSKGNPSMDFTKEGISELNIWSFQVKKPE